MTKYIVFDISNLLYRTFYAEKDEDSETLAGLATHQALMTLNKFYKNFNPDKAVMCFDRKSWRKEYTASDKCISGKLYKGHRRKDMTKKEKEKYQEFLEHLKEFEDIMRKYTSVICLAADGLEADDFVAGFVQKNANKNNEIYIISTDKDYIQLLKYENVKLINPVDSKERTLEDWENDADLFMFEKCIRGDASDNVQSAYPRIRKTRIRKAWTDPIERLNIMEHVWTNHEGKEMKVGDIFKENQLLMDLSKQPEEYKKILFDVIEKEMNKNNTFSYFHFLKFLKKYEMNRIAEQLDYFIPLLS